MTAQDIKNFVNPLVKIIKEWPPFIEDIIAAGLKPASTTVFPYGLTIYNPSGLDIPDDIMIHEAVHIAQQGENPADWWKRYIFDKNFRLSQEIEANREQYKFICKIFKDRNQRVRALDKIAKNMSGEIYGNMISYLEALKAIK